MGKWDDLIQRLGALQGGVAPSRFITAKGSEYVLLPNGSSVRYKAPRLEHPNEEGWQKMSDSTVFLDPDQANILSIVQAQGPRPMTLVRDTDTNRVAAAYADALRPIRETIVSPRSEPDVGLLPLEMIRGYTPHFGNPITAVRKEPDWKQWLMRQEANAPPPVWVDYR